MLCSQKLKTLVASDMIVLVLDTLLFESRPFVCSARTFGFNSLTYLNPFYAQYNQSLLSACSGNILLSFHDIPRL